MGDANSTVLVIDDDPALRASVARGRWAWMLSCLGPFPTFLSSIRRMALARSSAASHHRAVRCAGHARNR
jgi:hypothetical protein